MNIGDKITVSVDGEYVITRPFNITTISSVVPVQHKDDGNEEWYEVCDADKTSLMAIVGKDIDGGDIVIIINKETCDTNLLLDLL